VKETLPPAALDLGSGEEPPPRESRKATAVSTNEEKAGLDFLDFLFTVAISVGLTPEVLNGATGLLSEKWQVEGRWPNHLEWIQIGVFIVGFLNLTLSWFGYHASIRSRPLNYFSGYGLVRFMLDVLLVIVYGIILIKYRSPNVVFFLLWLVWLIFVIWDVLKVREYWRPEPAADGKYFGPQWDSARTDCPSEYKAKTVLKVFRREFVTLFWFLILCVIVLVRTRANWNEWIFIIAAASVTVFYRFNKNHAMWERIFGVSNE
jgi:hypothetical protein